MVKGVNDKQSGFWMYLEQMVRPELEWKLRRHLRGPELQTLGQNYWASLSYEEKEEWKARAKEFNRSEAGQCETRLKRLEYRQRKHFSNKPMNLVRPSTSQKLKPSNIIPPSGRYDEVDEYSRKYFAGVDDDFEGMRLHQLKEFIDQYQWKFARKDPKLKETYFYGKEIIVATANVYYEDNCAERMVPSEISILKFSIADGICGQRHYILGYGEREIPNEICMTDAEENMKRTGLRMDATSNVRFDYAQIWNEIKAFTEIDGDGAKLFVLSDEWNTVVGAFDALFVHAREQSFSRIESRFATLEDYFLAVYATVRGVSVDEEIKIDTATGMRERWPGAVFYDLVICNFHAELRYKDQCKARSCSLFAAHEATFNFFTLCKKYVFPMYPFTGNHMPDKTFLPRTEEEYLPCTTQRLHRRRFTHVADDFSTQRTLQPVVASSFEEKRPLKSILKKPSSTSVYHGRSTSRSGNLSSVRQARSAYSPPPSNEEDDELASVTGQPEEVHYDVEKWLQEQQTVPQEDSLEIDFHPRNPHITNSFGGSFPTQIPSASFSDHVRDFIVPDTLPRSNSGVSEKRSAEKQIFSNCRPPSVNTKIGSVMGNNEFEALLPTNGLDRTLTDMPQPADNDSDSDMFSNVSLPASSVHRKRFPAIASTRRQQIAVEKSSERGQQIPNTASSQISPVRRLADVHADAPLTKPVDMRQNSATSVSNNSRIENANAANTVPDFIQSHSNPVGVYGAAPLVPLKSPEVQSLAGNPSQSGPTQRTKKDFSKNLSPDAPKPQDSISSKIDLLPTRTFGGFSIPSVVRGNSIRTKRNSSTTSLLSKSVGCSGGYTISSDQFSKKATDLRAYSGINHSNVPNGMPIQMNPHLSNGQLTFREQEKNNFEILSEELGSLLSSSDATNATVCARRNQTATTVFTLKPLTYIEAETLGWLANATSSDGRQFDKWLKSVHLNTKCEKSSY